jgi:hypothetical protein
MHEHIFTRGTLNKAVSFGSVKPLHCALLSHKQNSFRLDSKKFSAASTRQREKVAALPGQLSRNKKGRGAFQQPVRPRSSTALYKNINQNLPAIGRELPGCLREARHNKGEVWIL